MLSIIQTPKKILKFTYVESINGCRENYNLLVVWVLHEGVLCTFLWPCLLQIVRGPSSPYYQWYDGTLTPSSSTQDIVTFLIQKLSIHSHDCNPSRQNRLSCPNVTGRTVGSACSTSPDHSRSVGLCYGRIRLRSDNDRRFHITEDSTPTFSLFVS